MSDSWFNTFLHLVFVSFRYNPRPCTGQGVSCRDGAKCPHITFWKDPFTPHSFPVGAYPLQDRLFYNLFFFSFFLILSSFPRQLFLGALCPSCLHCPLHSTAPIFIHYKLPVTYGVYAKCSFVSILNKSLENFNTFLSTDLCSMTANDQESLVMKSSFYSKHSETT